jgi:hypothetical protein
MFPDRLEQHTAGHGFADEVVASGSQALLAILIHSVGGERDDGSTVAMRA